MRHSLFSWRPSYIILIVIIGLAYLSYSCSGELKIKLVQVDPDPVNVLRQEIEVRTNNSSNVFIEYWESGTSKHYKTGTSSDREEHHFTMINLVEETTYTMQAVVKNSSYDQKITSEEIEFRTGTLPDFLPEYNFVTEDLNIFTGYVLARKVNYPSSNILLNNKGEIVWYQAGDSSLMNPFSLTERNTVLMLENEDNILEIDFYGNELFRLTYGEKGFDRHLHHEIRKDEKGNILALTREIKIVDLSDKGGLKEDTIKGDGILLLDPKGNKLWSWNIFKVADPLEDKDINRTKIDWSHANALNVDLDGNYLISYHHFDQIWKIDSQTGELIWKLGKNGDFKMDEKDWFYKQHAVHRSSDNNLMLFDNGDVFRTISRGIKFEINEPDMTAISTMTVFLPDSLFSFKQGSVFQMTDEFLLFCSTTKNRIAITNNNGKVMWQVNGSDSHYRAYYINELPLQQF